MIAALEHDALIAGGGPAGAMLATLLAREGRTAVLVERSRAAHHKVCGDFLSPESLPQLAAVGVNPQSLGAQTIRAVRIAARDVIADVELPAPALSLTRHALDEALLTCAKQAGANVLRGYAVEHLKQEDKLWFARIADGTGVSMSLRGRDAFLAVGKHNLRGWARDSHGTQSNLVAFKMYFSLAPSRAATLAGHVEIMFFPGGYAGLQPVEKGAANLCALVTQEKLRNLGGSWRALLEHMQQHAPTLAHRLSDARPLLARPLALSSIPYGYCASATQNALPPWRLGDQAAVIPSFAGDGIAIALHTARRAAEMYLSGYTAEAFHAEVRSYFRMRLAAATWLSRILITLPAIVHAVQLRPSILRDIFAATRVPASASTVASI